MARVPDVPLGCDLLVDREPVRDDDERTASCPVSHTLSIGMALGPGLPPHGV
jgi:hypothetical protein